MTTETVQGVLREIPVVDLWEHIDTIIHALEIARSNATFRMQDAAPHGPTYAEAHSEFVSCNELLTLIDSAQDGKGECCG